MNETIFFNIYIPAIEAALENDWVNDVFHVKPPLDYVDDQYIQEVDSFMEINYDKYASFFDKIAYYFDAKSHNFPSIDGVSIERYKLEILAQIDAYKKAFNLK